MSCSWRRRTTCGGAACSALENQPFSDFQTKKWQLRQKRKNTPQLVIKFNSLAQDLPILEETEPFYRSQNACKTRYIYNYYA